MITAGKMVFVIVLAVLAGAVFSLEAIHVFEVRNAPIVSGHVVSREPIQQYSVPRADFTIRIDGGEMEVHAHTQRYLISKVPDVVRFHYSGDPAREVFLFEHEENPYWVVLFCWGTALALAVSMRVKAVRHALGWKV